MPSLRMLFALLTLHAAALTLAPCGARGQATFDSPIAAAPLALTPESAARDRVLLGQLTEMHEGARARPWFGALQLALGGTALGLGIALPADGVDAALILLGSAMIARATLVLALAPRAGPLLRAYRALPLADAEQVRARLHYGEQALAQLARAGRRLRVADASLGMATAAAYVPLFWGLQRGRDASYRFGDTGLDYVALTCAVLQFASSMMGLFSRSEAEQRWAAYREFRERLARAAWAPPPDITGEAAPPKPGGQSAMVTLDYAF